MKKRQNWPLVTLIERFVSTRLASISEPVIKPRATILVYHNVPSETDRSKLRNDSVSADDFERQMLFLKENSFNVISLKTLIYFLRSGNRIPRKSIIVTFDDGYKTAYTNAYPILKKYGIPATIFLAVGFIGKSKRFPWLQTDNGDHFVENPSAMNWDEVRQLHDAGIEIGSHTLSHRLLPKLDIRDIEEEILASQAIIQERLSHTPRALALPFSFPIVHSNWPNFKSALLRTLKKGKYTSCCTMLRRHISSRTDPFILGRLPVGKFDDLALFNAKLVGSYTWTRFPQYMFQNFLKKYHDV